MWIDVDDELPEIGQRVLVYCPYDHIKIKIAKVECYREAEFWWSFSGNTGAAIIPGRQITHWAPLPDGPK